MNMPGFVSMDRDVTVSLALLTEMLKEKPEQPQSVMNQMKEFFQFNPILERIPRAVLQDATMIAFLHTYAGAVGVGVESTSGIVMVRLSQNKWSAPISISGTGVSLGISAGAGRNSAILVGSKDYNPQRIAQATREYGLEMVGTVGPIGEKELARLPGTVDTKERLYSYTCGRGLLAGYSIKTTGVYPNQDAMKAFYGHDVDVQAIMVGKAENDIFEKKPDLHKLQDSLIELSKSVSWIKDS